MNSYEKSILEKWMQQIKSGELDPQFLGYDKNRDEAVKMIQKQLNDLKLRKNIL